MLNSQRPDSRSGSTLEGRGEAGAGLSGRTEKAMIQPNDKVLHPS